jgi:acetylornithine deacetylase/succinyl-diaminopimelate desuccinylase-like protein
LSSEYLAKNLGYRAKLAILPDGGDENELVSRQKGFWQIEAEIFGKNAHASQPWAGENPIEIGYQLYARLLSLFPQPEDQFQWQTSIALTKISAGKALNQIPDKATLCFDIRYTDETIKQKLADEINSFLFERGLWKTIAENGIFNVDTKNEQVDKLKKAIEKVLQKKVEFTIECGTSDAIFFAEQGTPSILFRPKGEGMHQAVEWVDKKSLQNFQAIILEYLRSL